MRRGIPVILLGGLVGLTSCATTSVVSTNTATMAPGMVMATVAGGPSSSALLICGPEIRRDVAGALGLSTAPPAAAAWRPPVYTCTYRLSGGSLVLSVRQEANASAARTYFTSRRSQLGVTHALTGLTGLGLPAYETSQGSVVFQKDDMTLEVDARQVRTGIGRQPTARTDLAYEVATDVMGCWSGS